LGIVISTQSPNPHHVMSELVDYSLAIIDGSLPPDPTFYGCVYAAKDDCDPWDEEVWFDCNPALDDFRSLDEMREFAKKAQKLPQQEAVFRSLYLNQRVETSDRFVTSEAYDLCVGTVPDFTGRPVWCGLDLAAVQDLTALVLIPEPLPGEPFYVLPFAWCPAASIHERTKTDRVPYETWRRKGFIESTKGSVVDYGVILHKIDKLAKMYDIKGIAFDAWGSQKIVHDLEEMKINVIEFRQGMVSMAAPVRELEKLILNQEIVFPDNALLKWNFSNVVCEQDAAGNRKFSKGKAVEKIDLCVSTLMALDACIRNMVEEPGEPSVMWL